MIHGFFQFSRSWYLSLFTFSFSFTQLSARTSKSTFRQVLFFFLLLLFSTITWSGRLVVWPRLGDLFVSQNPKEFYASHFFGRILCCAYYYYYYFTPWEFLTSALADGFSLDSKSPQVSRTFLGILANLKNAVVWIVSIRPLVSKSPSPFTKPLVTVPRATITIGITVTFMFHCFFNSQARFENLSYFSLSLNLTLWSAGTIQQVFFFLFFFLFFFFFFCWL